MTSSQKLDIITDWVKSNNPTFLRTMIQDYADTVVNEMLNKPDLMGRIEILNAVTKYTGVPVKDIKGKCRKRHIVEARLLYSTACSRYTRYSLHKIGKVINRHHSSIIHHLYTQRSLIATNERFSKWFKGFELYLLSEVNKPDQ